MSQTVAEIIDNPSEGGSLADRVFRQVQDAIVRGDLSPGSKLNETDLVRQLGASRGPLREAIRRLEERQLVTRIPYAGVRVAELSREELIDIYLTRESLETMAAGLAAHNMSDVDIDDLEVLLETHKQQITREEWKNYYQREGNQDFHYRIVMGSGNRVLKQIYSTELYHRIRMYRFWLSTKAGRPQLAFREHTRITEAIRYRDKEMAELLMRRHIQNAWRNLDNTYFQDNPK